MNELEAIIYKSEKQKEATSKIMSLLEEWRDLSLDEQISRRESIYSDIAILHPEDRKLAIEQLCAGNIVSKRDTIKKVKEIADTLGIDKKEEIAPKIYEIPTCFELLEDGTIIEMCLDWDNSPATFFAVYNNGDIKYKDWVEKDPLTKFVPFKPDVDSVRNGLVRFPSKAEEYNDDESLIKEIKEYVHKLLDVSVPFLNLVPYYILFTWVYDLFYEVAYLRSIGDYGTGKGRFLKTIGRLCYKPMMVGSVTASYAFRMIEKYKGTLCIDEADFKDSTEYDRFMKILNCGFEKGTPVGITEQQGKTFKEVSFNVFGPKLLATRNKWKDVALESRCITEEMLATSRKDIPINWQTEFDEEALKIRNKLLMWRFLNYSKKGEIKEEIDWSIEPRFNQIIRPLLSIIDNITVREDLKNFVREYNRQIVEDRGMKFEALVISAIWELYILNKEQGSFDKITMKDIADKINIKYSDELESGKITPKKVGWIVRSNLRLKSRKTRDGATLCLSIEKEQQKLRQLKERYGVVDSEEKTVDDVSIDHKSVTV